MNSIITVVGALLVSATGLTGAFYDDIDNLVNPESITIDNPLNESLLPSLPPPPPLPDPSSIPRPEPPQPDPPQPPEDPRDPEDPKDPEPCEGDNCGTCEGEDCQHCHDGRDCQSEPKDPEEPRDPEEPQPCDDCRSQREVRVHSRGHDRVDDCAGMRDIYIYEQDTVLGAYHEQWRFDVDCPIVKKLEVSFQYSGVRDVGSYVTWNPYLVLRDGDGDIMAGSETEGVRTGETDQGLYFLIEGDLGSADLGEWLLDFSACTHVGDYTLEITVSY